MVSASLNLRATMASALSCSPAEAVGSSNRKTRSIDRVTVDGIELDCTLQSSEKTEGLFHVCNTRVWNRHAAAHPGGSQFLAFEDTSRDFIGVDFKDGGRATAEVLQ